MKFEEIKNIWDEQNRAPLYTINEQVLHERIKQKRKETARAVNIGDYVLTALSLGTAAALFLIFRINETLSFFGYVMIAVFLSTAAYVWSNRIRRKRQDRRYDQTMRGNLDQAIFHAQFDARRSGTMVWWYLLPVAGSTFLMMAAAGALWWQWLLVMSTFILSWLVIQWGLNRHFNPQKEQLERLRSQLMEEAPPNGKT